MDYNSLKDQIRAYSNRDDDVFIAQIPNFIDQAMNKIYMEAKNIGFQTIVNGTLTADNAFLAKPLFPNVWKETISLTIIDDSVTPNLTYNLFSRTYEFCRIYNRNNVTGLPKFYSDYALGSSTGENARDNNLFYLSAIPDRAYPYSLVYLSLPIFNEANPTNFITDRYPSLLLYACMSEAMPFFRDDERIPVFSSMYDRALQAANKETVSRYTDRTAKRDKD